MTRKPDYQREGITLYCGDCLEILPEMSCDCLLADPPYCRYLNEEWDNQWKTTDEYLDWLGRILEEVYIGLAMNGSVYIFASSQMAGRVEMCVRQRFNVLASIVWNKGDTRKGVGGTGIDLSTLRTWWQASSERIIFAEQFGSDRGYRGALVNENYTYWTACEDAKRSVFGNYLVDECKRAGVSRKDVAALFPSKNGNLTGCVSNWVLGYNCPTVEQYEAIRERLGDGYLRREYEDLRREYEDLRRPFQITSTENMGDVWSFPSTPTANSLHPCQKPMGLVQHIINTSTRAGQTILDPFIGSGTTAIACIRTGRKCIGIELEQKYFDIAVKRIDKELDHPRLCLFDTPTPVMNRPELNFD